MKRDKQADTLSEKQSVALNKSVDRIQSERSTSLGPNGSAVRLKARRKLRNLPPQQTADTTPLVEARRQKVLAIRGKYAGIAPSVDDYLRQKENCPGMDERPARW